MKKMKPLPKRWYKKFKFIQCGLECGEGWNQMLYELCTKIQQYITDTPLQSNFRVTQIKEKFGTLRFYCSGTTETIEHLIDQYEIKSSITCENCGQPGKTVCIDGWYSTLCKMCIFKRCL